jgi:putative phosphoribosyl transferase
VTDKTAIVVDDGLATGATARASIHALRRRAPRRVVLAIPVAPAETLEELASEVDETICLARPEYFYAIGAHYDDFREVSDEQVIALFKDADELMRDVEE